MISFLRGNLIWIVLSLVLSTGLWIFITFQENPEKSGKIPSVPVEIQNPPNTVIVQSETLSVDVEVSAPSDVWPLLRADKLRATVDASKVAAGVSELPVKVTSTDPRARIDGWSPEKVTLRVDNLGTKKVPVQVVTRGSVPSLYESGSPTVTPTEVTITGPQANVGQVAAAVVEVTLDGAIKSIGQGFRPVPETVSGTKVDRITITPEQVVVDVPVQQQLQYKTLPVQARTKGNVAIGYQVAGYNVDPTSVTLVGDPKTLGQLEFVTTQPVDIDGATSDREVQADLALPGTVALYRAQPVVVRVLITPLQGSATFITSLKPVNGQSDVTYSVIPGTISVTLSGPIPALSHLGADDITATVDVRGLSTGTHNLPIAVKVPPLLKQEGVQPTTVTVTARSVTGT